METWLAGQPGVARALAEALLFVWRAGAHGRGAHGTHALRGGCKCTSKEALLARLAKGDALDRLADTLVVAFTKLQAAETVSVAYRPPSFMTRFVLEVELRRR